MKYYYHPWSPNCRKTTALIDHLGLEAERKVVDLAAGENMKPEFLAVNPGGMVPALEDGSFPNEIVGLVPEDEFSAEDIPLMPEETPSKDMEIEFAFDPSPYLGTIRSQVMGVATWLPLRCQESVP